MAIHNVSNAVQLQAALTKAAGGDRIVLASGSYGMVSIQNKKYASAVTIETASSTNPAHFDGLNITGSRNLTISGLDLGRGLKAGEADTTALNWINKSKNIVMNGVKIHGSMDGNPANDGVGLIVRDSSSVVVNNSDFEQLHRGMFIQRGYIVNVNNNEFQNIRSDGVNVAATKNISIAGNQFSKFSPIPGDHGDAIQFWNKNEKSGSESITIRDNILMQTGNGEVQGIFMSDAGAYRYKNVNIHNNLIYSNGAYNGIAVRDADKISVTNNTVVSEQGDTHKLWIYLTNSSSAYVKNNISDVVRVEKNLSASQYHNGSVLLDPSLKRLFGDINTPDSISDLLTAGYGYSVPGSPRPTAMEGLFAGNNLSEAAIELPAAMEGLFAGNNSLEGAIELPEDDLIDTSRLGAEAVSEAAVLTALPVDTFADLDPIVSTPDSSYPMHQMLAGNGEWFVALP